MGIPGGRVPEAMADEVERATRHRRMARDESTERRMPSYSSESPPLSWGVLTRPDRSPLSSPGMTHAIKTREARWPTRMERTDEDWRSQTRRVVSWDPVTMTRRW